MTARFQARIDAALPADYFIDEPVCPCGNTMVARRVDGKIVWVCNECEKQEDEQ